MDKYYVSITISNGESKESPLSGSKNEVIRWYLDYRTRLASVQPHLKLIIAELHHVTPINGGRCNEINR